MLKSFFLALFNSQPCVSLILWYCSAVLRQLLLNFFRSGSTIYRMLCVFVCVSCCWSHTQQHWMFMETRWGLGKLDPQCIIHQPSSITLLHTHTHVYWHNHTLAVPSVCYTHTHMHAHLLNGFGITALVVCTCQRFLRGKRGNFKRMKSINTWDFKR